MELSVAIQAKVEVTPSNWNFGFQPTITGIAQGVSGDCAGNAGISEDGDF